MRTSALTKILASSALALTSLTTAALVGGTAQATTTPVCSPSTLAKNSGTVNITFEESMPGGAISGNGNRGVLASLIAAYNASQTKVHVTDVNDSGGYTDTWTKYTADLASGSGTPQVVMFDQYDTQAAADTQSIIPASSCISNDKAATPKTFVKKAIGAYSLGSTIEGMPFSVSTPVMYYNLQAFKKAGIKSPPTTMDQLIADQRLLQTAGYQYGVALKKDPWITMTWLAMEDKSFVNNGNGHTARATAANFNNSSSQQYWSKFQTIIRNGGLASNTTGSLSQAYANIFAISNNKAGITFDTTAALGSIQSALPLFSNVTLGVAPLPTLTGKFTGSTPPGGNGLFIPKADSPLQAAAAWDFIKYLTSATSIGKWAVGTGYLPIRSDAVSSWKAKLTAQQFAWYNVAYSVFSKGASDTATAGPILGAYASVSNELVTGLNSLTQSPWPSASSVLASAESAATADILSYNSRI